MKAVVMAGGEGTRLRPMTASMPKPLLPVVNRPIMEHVLRLLRRHGMTDVVVTVQFLASLVRNYFGDGEELGMTLPYATEEEPLGHGGQREERRGGARRRHVPGDQRRRADRHRPDQPGRVPPERKALVTVCLTRVPDPLEFGITIVDEDGRVQRFLEKPTWGQVFSDTVNTGIYVMEPEVFDYVKAGEPGRLVRRRLPAACSNEGRPVFGYVAEGYWEDVGTLESYHKAQADVLEGRVNVDIDGFEMSPRRLGRPRAPRSTPRPGCADRCTSATTPRSRPAPSCASTPCSAATSSSAAARSCTARSSTTTSSSARTPTCAAAWSARTPT